MVQQQTIEQAKITGDALSIGTVIATVAGWLPEVAALFSIVWVAMQIYINWDKVKEKFNRKKD